MLKGYGMRYLATGLLLMACASANAAIITFDPNDYAAGTNLSHAQPGVTVAHYGWPDGFAPGSPVPATRTYDVVATRCGSVYYSCSSEEQLGFGMSSVVDDLRDCTTALTSSRRCFGANNLEFTFTDPTDYVAFSANWYIDPVGMLAYDVLGNLLYSCWGPLCTGTSTPNTYEGGRVSNFSLSRSEGDIHRIIVGSFAGSGFISGLQYSSVPEPGTLALLSVGLLGLGMRKRAKRA